MSTKTITAYRIIMTAGTSLVDNVNGPVGKEKTLNKVCAKLKCDANSAANSDHITDGDTRKKNVLHELKKLDCAANIDGRPHDKKYADRFPQELSYLYLLLKKYPDARLEVHMLHSDTPIGTACAEIIKDYIDDPPEASGEPWCRIASVELVKVEGLNTNPPNETKPEDEHETDFEKDGAPNLIAEIIELANTTPENTGIIINPTGGFKELIPYATIAAAFVEREWEMHYLFATSKHITVLPSYPIGLDFPLWHREETLRSAASKNPVYEDALNHRMKAVAEAPDNANAAQKKLQEVYKKQVDTSALQEYSLHVIRLFFPDAKTDKGYSEALTRIVKELGPLIWLGDKLEMSVDHAAEHHCHLLEIAQLLLLPMLEVEKEFLSTEQRYVLLAALLLHDCGHTLDALPLDGDEDNLIRLFPSEVRNWHHLLAFRRIKQFPKDIAFENAPLADEVAHLALYHRRCTGWETIEEGNAICPINGQVIKPPLEATADCSELKAIDLPKLVALIRLIDGCDNQSRRVGPAQKPEAWKRQLERDQETNKAELKCLVKACNGYMEIPSARPGLKFIDDVARWLDDTNKPMPKIPWKARVRLLSAPDPVWRELWTATARTFDEMSMSGAGDFHTIKHQAVERIFIYPDKPLSEPPSDGLWSMCFDLRADEEFVQQLDCPKFAEKYSNDMEKKTLREFILDEISSELSTRDVVDDAKKWAPVDYLAEAADVPWRLTFRWVNADGKQIGEPVTVPDKPATGEGGGCATE